MSEDRETQQDDASRARAERARLARIFGDVLPEGTSDDRGDSGNGGDSGDQRSTDWFQRERPPHHF